MGNAVTPVVAMDFWAVRRSQRMRKTPKMIKKQDYLLRDIPPALWRKAKHVAVEENATLRAILLRALEEFCKVNKR